MSGFAQVRQGEEVAGRATTAKKNTRRTPPSALFLRPAPRDPRPPARMASRRQATLHEWISREFDLLASAGVCRAFLERCFRERAALARQLHGAKGSGGEEGLLQAIKDKTHSIAELQDELAHMELADPMDESRHVFGLTLRS